MLATSTGGTILITVVAFLILLMVLVALLLFTKEKLSPSGPVTITINGEKKIEVGSGSSLLSTLGNEKVFLPSACGGGGTCIQCECHVLSGGGEALPTETPHFSKRELNAGARLACQVKVKQDMEITIPEEVFGIKKWPAKVVRNYNVASFIKEFVVEIQEDMGYKAGGYIQIEIPACEINYKDIDITAHPEEHETPDKFQDEWDKFNLWPLTMKNPEMVERAYSMASFPAEGKEIMLNVRIATPPWDRAKNGWMAVNPGVASSYIFSLKKGDDVTISGPYGEFFINESDSEMLYVGGGAGKSWEEEVGMPARLKLEDIRSQRLTEAMGAKAGYLERRSASDVTGNLELMRQQQKQRMFDYERQQNLADRNRANREESRQRLQDRMGSGGYGGRSSDGGGAGSIYGSSYGGGQTGTTGPYGIGT
ncbi:hypothetical protein LCGC14_0784810, partial [marine sediment metagenome]